MTTVTRARRSKTRIIQWQSSKLDTRVANFFQFAIFKSVIVGSLRSFSLYTIFNNFDSNKWNLVVNGKFNSERKTEVETVKGSKKSFAA